MMTSDVDLELIVRAKRGDLSAFGELVSTYQSLVINFCYRMLLNREDAEDIAQETFLRAFAAIGAFQPKAKFSTWLLTIAKNLSLNFLRNKRKRGQYVDSTNASEAERRGVDFVRVDNPEPDHVLLQNERAEWVHNALQGLSDTHRTILILRSFEDMTYDEIAKIMGCRKGTVKSRLSRARDHLREILLKQEMAVHYGMRDREQDGEQ